MDTNIIDLDPSIIADILGTGDAPARTGGPHFSGKTELPIEGDILQGTESTKGETTQAPQSTSSGTEETTQSPETESVKDTDATKEADILTGEKNESTDKDKPFDVATYYQDRLKSGKFVRVETENEKGEKVLFVPQTLEELDEVIDLQLDHQLEQKSKDVDKNIYASKTPVWQALLKYSELVDDPSELIPFMQGMKTLKDVSQLDETQIEGAEQIVRIRMELAGDPPEIIDDQIEALKTSDKLIATAAKVKPIIQQQEQQKLLHQQQAKEQEMQEYQQLVTQIEDGAVKAINAPIFGKYKLKREEQAAIYDLIAVPSKQSGGYSIYTEIDNLFKEGNFEKLKQVALLLSNEKSFYTYSNLGTADSTASKLQKKIAIAADSKVSSGDADADDKRQVIQRSQGNQFNKAPRFGR